MVFLAGWYNRMRLRLGRAASKAGQDFARSQGRHPGRPKKLPTQEEIEAAQAALRAAGKTGGARPVAAYLTAQRMEAAQAALTREGKSTGLKPVDLRKLKVTHVQVLRSMRASRLLSGTTADCVAAHTGSAS